MFNEFSRTEQLIGKEALEILKTSTVAVFGIGGVGGYVVEALARSGVGHFVLIDNDTINVTNINRQIIALHSTIGLKKVEVMKARLIDINPEIITETYDCFYNEENSDNFEYSKYNYIVDAIDSVKSKILLIETAINNGVKIISSMGTGNKLDPTRLEISDIYKTEVCPLARVVRRELKSRGIKKLKVLYSKEIPIKISQERDLKNDISTPPASISFVPSAAGLIIAGEVIKDMIK